MKQNPKGVGATTLGSASAKAMETRRKPNVIGQNRNSPEGAKPLPLEVFLPDAGGQLSLP